MASNRRKSAAIALAVVGIAGLSLASAAQLNLNTASLGAGTDIVASCDDQIDVDFTSVLAGSTYSTTEVVLSDLAVACEGLNYRLQVLQDTSDTDDTKIPLGAEEFGVLDADDSTTITLDAAVGSSAVTGVSVVIYGQTA